MSAVKKANDFFFFSGIKVCVYVKYLQTKIRSVLKKSEALERVMNQGPDEGFDGWNAWACFFVFFTDMIDEKIKAF